MTDSIDDTLAWLKDRKERYLRTAAASTGPTRECAVDDAAFLVHAISLIEREYRPRGYVTPAMDYDELRRRLEARARNLNEAEKRAQAKRCGCRGTDSDYCGCQNVPDATTVAARLAGRETGE